jgi:hypothetical protein
MTQSELPSTEDGSNWTVAVFDLPRENWAEILKGLLRQFENKEAKIPHYKIMRYVPESYSLKISFRVLRLQKHESLIKAKMAEALSEYKPQIDLPKSVQHHWIEKGLRMEYWTLERCQILNELSKDVLKIIRSDTSLGDKENWTHLFSNMAGVFELFKIYRSPETMLNPDQTQSDRALNYFPETAFQSELK